MKILLITVRSDFGGGPRHVDQLVNNLSNNFDVFMAYPDLGVPYGVKWNSDSRIRGRLFIPFRRFSLKTLLKLRLFIKNNGINVVHSHGNGAGIYSRLLKILIPKIKVIHTFHGISDNYSSIIKNYMVLGMGKLLSPFADNYICVSYGEMNKALKKHFSSKDKTTVIYNGIKISKIERLSEFNGANRIFKIVTLSRFDYSKNMDFMYRIASHWKKSHDVLFVWVGDGEDRYRLEAMSLKDEVPIQFVGFSPDPFKYLSSSDLYLSTSRFEGLPYALVEALSVGLPIVATDVSGNNEVVRPGFNGFLFKEENQAVEYIERFINAKVTYNLFSKNARDDFESRFTEDEMIRKTISIYN